MKGSSCFWTGCRDRLAAGSEMEPLDVLLTEEALEALLLEEEEVDVIADRMSNELYGMF